MTDEERAERVAFLRQGATKNAERSKSNSGWYDAIAKQHLAYKADALTAAADALEAQPGHLKRIAELESQLAGAKRIGAAEYIESIADSLSAAMKEPNFVWLDTGPAGIVLWFREEAARYRQPLPAAPEVKA